MYKALCLCELKIKHLLSTPNPQTMKNFHFGENLRMMRNYRGYTQEAMAKDLTCHRDLFQDRIQQ